MIAAVDLALDTGASVYDCLHVALAISSNCSLITADSRVVAEMAGHAACRIADAAELV